MIKAIIQYKGNTLITQFPVAAYRLSDQLNSIGITVRSMQECITSFVGFVSCIWLTGGDTYLNTDV